MKCAEEIATNSKARRLKVGCIVVRDDGHNERIISQGWNGTPSGDDNNCEIEQTYIIPDFKIDEYKKEGYTIDYSSDDDQLVYATRLVTKPEVLHAERNALDKITRSTESSLGASLFVTHSPCLECAKSIYGSGIAEVYFGKVYRSEEGLEFLRKHKVRVVQINK